MATRRLMTSVLRRGLGPLLLGGLLLAGCAEGMHQRAPGRSGATPPVPANRPSAASEPVVDTGTTPPPERSPETAKLTPTVPPKPAPAPRKELPPLPLEALIGLDRDEATKMVGLPASVDEQPPAIIWRYKNKRCAVTLHFYLEVKQKSYRILRTQVETTDGTDIAAQACLDSIRASN